MNVNDKVIKVDNIRQAVLGLIKEIEKEQEEYERWINFRHFENGNYNKIEDKYIEIVMTLERIKDKIKKHFTDVVNENE